MARSRAERDRLCRRMAQVQYGVLSRAQALAAGHTDSSIHRQIASGAWLRLLPRAYCLSGAPQTWERDLIGSVFWAGDGSAASDAAAAHLIGLRGFTSSAIEIATVGRPNPKGLPIKVHKVHRELLKEIVEVRRIPCTSPRRTVMDLAGSHPAKLEGALDDALRKGLTTIGQMWLLYEEEWMRGRRGVARLRSLLQARTKGEAPTDSEMEIRALRLLRKYGIRPPVTQHPIVLPSGVEIHVDLAYPDARLGIELDSYGWHLDRAAFERDRERDLELGRMGWLILRITWAKLRWEPGYVADLIRHHLHERTRTSA